MPLLSAYQVSLAAVFTIVGLASGQPRIAYPVNSQLPPVAYVHQPFEFVFSPVTFSSRDPGISYALSNQPDWIHLDSDTRKLKGIPTFTDLGAPEFQLLASDYNGQTSSSVTLVVLERKTLSAGGGILTQLAQAGDVSTPTTLLLHPSEPFTFNVTPHVFNGISTETVFYAVSSDGSPLPSWIHFDPQTITFSGTSLQPLAPGPPVQMYNFSLVASNVLGFSESKIDFTIVTTERLLAFTEPDLNVSVSKGSPVKIDTLLEQVSINGVGVSRDEIEDINSDPPPWLHLNDSDVSYNGVAPDDVQNASFSIALSCAGTNVANATVQLQVSQESSIGHVDLGTATAAAGTYFSFQLNQSSIPTESGQVDVDLGEFSSWLSYNTTNQTLHGLVPTNGIGQTQSLEISSNDTSTTVIATLVLVITKPSVTSSITSSIPGPTSTKPATTSTTAVGPGETTTSHTKQEVYPIILAIVLPTLAVIFLIWIVIMWIRKRRQQRKERPQGIRVKNISSPQPRLPSSGDENLSLSFDAAGREVKMRPGTDAAPRLELPWAPSSPTRTRRRRSRKPNLSQGGIIGPSWDDLLNFERDRREILPPAPANSGTSIEAQQVGSPLATRAVRDLGKAPKKTSDVYTGSRLPRATKLSGTRTSRVVDLPQRMSGAGHGTGISNALMSPDLRSSWQTTQGSIPIMMDSRPSTILLDAFPAPPSQMSLNNAGRGRRDSPLHDSKLTLRRAEDESNSSDSFEAARQYYYNQNAWDRLAGTAPLSNTAIRLIPNPHTMAAMSGSSGDPSTSKGSRALVSGPSSLRTRGNTAAITVGDNGQSQPAQGQALRSSQRDSVASSRQFDSALSSDSQWEDEDVTAEENTVGEVHWQSTTETTNRAWSRLPFEPSREAQHETPGGGAGAGSRRPRLADQRRHVSVEATEVGNPSRSHKGSFRFV